MTLRTVGVRLTAEVNGYVNNMRRATGTTKEFHQTLSQKASAGHLDAIADRAGVAGLALAGAFGYAAKASMDFETQMSAVKAATRAGASEMEKLRQAAIKAGADTQYSATEAAQGIEELSKAGVSTAAILSGGLKGALDLAAAGGLGVGEAAETAASAMTQFKLSGAQVPHVADLLSAAAGKAQGSVHDMGAALNQAGLVASQTGLSIEETTGGLAAFASAGLTGSDAGTSFKQMLLMLQSPSGKTRELMDELGISLYDAQGNTKGLSQFAGELKEKLSKLTPETRAAAMAQIFGADAVRGASILYEQGADGIQTWIDKTNDAGYASETAAIKTDNLAGDLERLKGSFDTLMISGGSGANSGLRIMVQALEKLIDYFGQLSPWVGQTAVVLGGLTGVLLLGAAAWAKVQGAIGSTAQELRKTGPAGERAALSLERTSKAAGKAALAFGAMTIAGAAVSTMSDQAINVDRLAGSLGDLVLRGQATGEMAEQFGKDMNGLGKTAQYAKDASGGFWQFFNTVQSGIPLVGELSDLLSKKLFGESFNGSKEKMKALDDALVQFMENTHNVRQAGEAWNQILLKSGLDTEELAKLLPNASDKLRDMQDAAHKGADATGQLKSNTERLNDEIAATREEAEKLQDAFDSLFKQYMSVDQANLKYYDSLRSTKKELKEGSKDLRENTEEGGKNRKAVLDLVSSINDQREANIRNGESVKDADKKYRDQIETLKKTMRNLGFTKDAVNDLLEKYDLIPPQVGTTIKTPGLDTARTGIKGYDKQLDALSREIKTNVSVKGDAVAYKKLEKLLVAQQAATKGISVSAARSAFNKNAGYAKGGWTGPGSRYDEAGVVHADEFVIQKSSRRKIEQKAPGLLDHMNTHGDLPGYATGGRVLNMPFPVNVAKTKVISMAQALAMVTPKIPSGGMTYKWIVNVVKQAFPGLHAISTFRPGSRTLSGSVSYHARGQAVDFPPSHALAKWWHDRYGRYTNELITPYNNLNIWRGKAHRYRGAVWNQHNFAGGNAHDHIALSGSLGSPGGAVANAISSGNLGYWITRALIATHTRDSWFSPLRTLINRESGGNPRAINLWDSNARRGTPSKGLMQLIDPTFRAYRMRSLSGNIYDPVANVAAGIRYIKSRYGSIFNVQQANPNRPPRGYSTGGLVRHVAMANGGVIGEPVIGVGASGKTYSFGERGPETVTPGAGRWMANQGGGGASFVTNYTIEVNVPPTANAAEVGRQVVTTIQAYERRSGKGWRN